MKHRLLLSSILVLVLSAVSFAGSAQEQYSQRHKDTNFDDPVAVFVLIDWAVDNKIDQEQIDKLYSRVLELDSENIKAHKALDHVKIDGEWIRFSTYMLQTGHLLVDGEWLSLSQAARLVATKRYDEELTQLSARLEENFDALTGKNQDTITTAFETLRSMEDEFPGVTYYARQVRSFQNRLGDGIATFDGKSTILELRLTRASLWWPPPLQLALSGGLDVFLPLPQQTVQSLKTTIIVPG